MSRVVFIQGWLTIILALAPFGAAAQKPLIDCSQEELVRAVPDLATIQFDSRQDSLDELLRVTGENLANMFSKFVDISAAEEINELRFDENMSGTNRRESFRYGISLLPAGGPDLFQEFRSDANKNAIIKAPSSNVFLILSDFFKLLNYLLPRYQEQSRFRYLGRWKSGGQELFVVAFAQRLEAAEPHSHIQVTSAGQTAPMQGLVWIDAATRRIVRLRLDLLGRVKGLPLETITTDISLIPVNFKAIRTVLWLPARVTVHGSFAGGDVHSVHRYSNYESPSGKAVAMTASDGKDAYELLGAGRRSDCGTPPSAAAQSGDSVRSF